MERRWWWWLVQSEYMHPLLHQLEYELMPDDVHRTLDSHHSNNHRNLLWRLDARNQLRSIIPHREGLRETERRTSIPRPVEQRPDDAAATPGRGQVLLLRECSRGERAIQLLRRPAGIPHRRRGGQPEHVRGVLRAEELDGAEPGAGLPRHDKRSHAHNTERLLQHRDIRPDRERLHKLRLLRGGDGPIRDLLVGAEGDEQ